MTRYFVWHDERGSAGDGDGHANGVYEAKSPGGARYQFLNEWDFDNWCEPLHIVRLRHCATCDGTGYVPVDDSGDGWADPEYDFWFCPDCVVKHSRKCGKVSK